MIARPVEELGEIAVSRLVDQIENRGRGVESLVLPTELISRGSVATI